MKTYILYIHDRRYSVPTLDTLTVDDDASAREVAAARLATSEDYQSGEIWEDDRLVGNLKKAPPPQA